MARNRDNGESWNVLVPDLDVRPVNKEHSIGGGGLLLGVGLEDFLADFAAHPVVLMRLKRRMAQVGFKQSEGFADLVK